MKKIDGNATRSVVNWTNWEVAPSPAVRNLFDAFDLDTDILTFTTVVPEFNADELAKVCKRLSSGKSGGPSKYRMKPLNF